MISQTQLQALKADFLLWRGSFEPETEDQVTLYLSVFMPLRLVESEACVVLEAWRRECDAS